MITGLGLELIRQQLVLHFTDPATASAVVPSVVLRGRHCLTKRLHAAISPAAARARSSLVSSSPRRDVPRLPHAASSESHCGQGTPLDGVVSGVGKRSRPRRQPRCWRAFQQFSRPMTLGNDTSTVWQPLLGIALALSKRPGIASAKNRYANGCEAARMGRRLGRRSSANCAAATTRTQRLPGTFSVPGRKPFSDPQRKRCPRLAYPPGHTANRFPWWRRTYARQASTGPRRAVSTSTSILPTD